MNIYLFYVNIDINKIYHDYSPIKKHQSNWDHYYINNFSIKKIVVKSEMIGWRFCSLFLLILRKCLYFFLSFFMVFHKILRDNSTLSCLNVWSSILLSFHRKSHQRGLFFQFFFLILLYFVKNIILKYFNW